MLALGAFTVSVGHLSYGEATHGPWAPRLGAARPGAPFFRRWRGRSPCTALSPG
jgi:hypothetical protein